MNPARATTTFRTKCNNIHHDGSIPVCLALTRKSQPISVNHDFSDSLQESLPFSEDSSMPGSTPTSLRRTYSSAEHKKAKGRWSKDEEKLLVNCSLKSTASREIARRSMQLGPNRPKNIVRAGKFQK